MFYANPARLCLPSPRLVVLTGASGSGKSTVAEHCVRARPHLPAFSFDSIGIPDRASMLRDHGSEPAWQKATIMRWMQRLHHERHPVALFEGQMFMPYLAEAAVRTGVRTLIVLLLDCQDETRFVRVISRGHRHLVCDELVERARDFRDQARSAGVPVIDTGRQSFGFVVRTVLAHCDDGIVAAKRRVTFHLARHAAFQHRSWRGQQGLAAGE